MFVMFFFKKIWNTLKLIFSYTGLQADSSKFESVKYFITWLIVLIFLSTIF